ncbi:MAG: glyoxalase [Prevotellaceae bacterium]|jgi:hypothetical protein|nr:glyoxalase [Prevotellaceae bacterium]
MNNEKENNIGRSVELKKPYLGYRYGTICGYEQLFYLVELTSGHIALVYEDEFNFMD